MSKMNKKEPDGGTEKEPELAVDIDEIKKPGKSRPADNKDDSPPGGKDTGKGDDKGHGRAAAGVKKRTDPRGEGGNGSAEEKASDEASAAANEQGEPDAGPIAELREDLAAERDKYLRLAAEYDNYRKRSIKEREMIYSDARADTIARILPVYDNLERALKMECADEAFYKGVEMTMAQLTQALDNMSLSQIPSVGEPFDPNRHNAVLAIEDPELGEKIIAEEYQKGFMLGDRVIRHSTVVVAN